MERGILMEVRGRNGVLLTRSGEFRSVVLPVGDWRVGDEIFTRATASGRRWLRPVVAAAAAILVLVGGPTGYWQWSLLQPSVVLAMEINPSLELTVNGKGRVAEARGLNADGQAVLQAIAWRNLPWQAVVQEATDQAIVMGKLDPAAADGAVVITAAPYKGEQLPEAEAQQIVTEAQVAAQTAVKTAAAAKGVEAHAQVKAVPTTASEVAQAKAAGLTVPEYKLYKSVQESLLPDLSPEAFQHKGPGAIIKEYGLQPDEVFSSMSKGRGKEHAPGQNKGDKSNEQRSDDTSVETQPADDSQSGGFFDFLFGRKNHGKDDNPGAPAGEQRPEGQSPSNQGPGKGNADHGDQKGAGGAKGTDDAKGPDDSKGPGDAKGAGGSKGSDDTKGAGGSKGSDDAKGAGDSKGPDGAKGNGHSKGPGDPKGTETPPVTDGSKSNGNNKGGDSKESSKPSGNKGQADDKGPGRDEQPGKGRSGKGG